MAMPNYQTYFEVPAFVKEASAEDVRLDHPNARIIRDDLRIDTKPSAWMAMATIKKEASEGINVPLYISDAVKQAADLFGISDNEFVERKPEGQRLMVKEASGEVEIDTMIYTPEQFTEVIQKLASDRDSLPYGFRRECASNLCRMTEFLTDSAVAESDVAWLAKEAGDCFVDADSAHTECDRRTVYALDNGLTEDAEVLEKLAAECDKLDTHDNHKAATIVEALDMFDRTTGFISKYADYGANHPEDTIFMSNEEYVLKLANMPVSIGNYQVPRKAFLVEESREAIQKWASAAGIELTDDMVFYECAEKLSTLTDLELREFSSRFGA